MVRRKVAGYCLVGFIALAGHGVATAQDPAMPLGGELDEAADPAMSLTPQQQLEQSRGFLGAMERTRDDVQRELDDARDRRDVVKSLCLDDKIAQLDVAISKVGDRIQGLESAVKRDDAELGRHEFTIISVLHQRAQQLDAEAKLCIGKEIVGVGDSDTRMVIDGVLPGEEQATTFPEVPLLVEPPTCASCFR